MSVCWHFIFAFVFCFNYHKNRTVDLKTCLYSLSSHKSRSCMLLPETNSASTKIATRASPTRWTPPSPSWPDINLFAAHNIAPPRCNSGPSLQHFPSRIREISNTFACCIFFLVLMFCPLFKGHAASHRKTTSLQNMRYSNTLYNKKTARVKITINVLFWFFLCETLLCSPGLTRVFSQHR